MEGDKKNSYGVNAKVSAPFAIAAIATLAVFFGGLFVWRYQNKQTVTLDAEQFAKPGAQNNQKEAVENVAENNGQIVGNDRDEYGCIGSAGYTWCEEKQKCLRSWEESCSENQKYQNKKFGIAFIIPNEWKVIINESETGLGSNSVVSAPCQSVSDNCPSILTFGVVHNEQGYDLKNFWKNSDLPWAVTEESKKTTETAVKYKKAYWRTNVNPFDDTKNREIWIVIDKTNFLVISSANEDSKNIEKILGTIEFSI